MRMRPNGAIRDEDFQLPALTGMGTHTEGFAVNGPAREDRGEGAKEGREVGIGGGGGAGITGGLTDEFDIEEKTSRTSE